MADVASALGISPALVFYHFETKDRLLAEAFAYAAERDLVRLDKVVGGKGTATQRLRAVLRLYSPSGSTPPGWTLWVDAWAAALRNTELRTVSRQLDLRWKEAVAAIIEDGRGSGEFTLPGPARRRMAHHRAHRRPGDPGDRAPRRAHPRARCTAGCRSWPSTSWALARRHAELSVPSLHQPADGVVGVGQRGSVEPERGQVDRRARRGR